MGRVGGRWVATKLRGLPTRGIFNGHAYGVNSGWFPASHITKCSQIHTQFSVTSQSYGGSVPAVCSSRQDGGHFIDHPGTRGRQTGWRKKPQLKQTVACFWLWYTHELLVYCCARRVAVKSKHWNCVRGRPLMANPVTHESLTWDHVIWEIPEAVLVLWIGSQTTHFTTIANSTDYPTSKSI